MLKSYYTGLESVHFLTCIANFDAEYVAEPTTPKIRCLLDSKKKYSGNNTCPNISIIKHMKKFLSRI